MDKLPNEMLIKIFQNVDQVDQLLNCKIVCKKWYSIIHQMIRLNSLVISRINGRKILSQKWFDPNEPIQFAYDYRYKVAGLSSKLISFSMNQPLLSQLKKLFIYNRQIWTDSINCLRQLEVLGFNDSNLISKTDISLNLPNLKVCSYRNSEQCSYSLNMLTEHKHNLTLNCPKLEKLDCVDLSLGLITGFSFGNITHPESIKELHASFNEDFIVDLVNCEYLYLESWNGYFNENILLKLKNLKELHLGPDVDFDSLTSLIRQKTSLNRTNLKMYYLNVPTDSLTQMDLYFMNSRSIDNDSIQFYDRNYSNLLNNAYFIDTVDYNVIENCFLVTPNQMARGMIKKLVYLKELILSDQIRDVDQFIGVLKDRAYLNRVRIKAEFMPQEFFDQILSENCPIIEILNVDNKNQLNFDFLLKLKELRYFFTKQQLTTDLIFKLFDKFESFKYLSFHYESIQIRIKLYHLPIRTFKIWIDDKALKKFDNLEDLVSCLKSYHHKTPFNLADYLVSFIF